MLVKSSNKLNILFKPFYIVVVILGTVLGISFLFVDSISVNLVACLLIFLQCIIDYYESSFIEDVNFSLGASIAILALLIYGPITPIIGRVVTYIILGLRLYKNNYKQMLIKTPFNISTAIICATSGYFVIEKLNINLHNAVEVWKIVMVAFSYSIVNYALVLSIVTFNLGRLPKKLDIKNIIMKFVFDSILTILTVYTFVDRGIFGVVLVWFVILQTQNFAQLKVRVKQQEHELQMDQLTDTYNYKYFESVLQEKINSGSIFSLIMIDLDRFKEINDIHGHIAGNIALHQLSKLIKKYIRKSDIFCRFGGDEFCILTDCEESAAVIAERLLNEIVVTDISYKDKHFKLSLSIGIYSSTGDEKSIEEVINRADNAMYAAKRNGGNQSVYSEEVTA